MWRTAAIGLLLLCSWNCGLVGPSCTERQERGTVTTVNGEVSAGQIVAHQVQYDTRGSQNDAQVGWVGQSTPGGPRIRMYATRVGCTDFTPPPAASDGACAVLASAGSFEGQIASTLIIPNGRGNPDLLGSPAEYKLWVVGDPEAPARYTITITWFYGPDC